MLKNTINYFWKTKIKNGWNNQNNYSATKNYRKLKYYYQLLSVTIEYSKALKIIREAKKVFQINGADKGSTNLLYGETKKKIKKTLKNEITK